MVDLLAWTCSAGFFFVTLFLIQSRGFLEGSRPIWLIALLLVPCWFSASFSIRFDARSGCAIAILLGFLRQPIDRQQSSAWYLSDLCLFFMMAGITATQFASERHYPLSPLDKIRELALPYVVGRLFLKSARDIETILPVFCWIITLLAGYAILEAVSRVNPIEKVLGKPWASTQPEFDEIRWGMKRAYAVQTHPIYLGLTFAMLMPWAVEAAVQSWWNNGPFWWRFVPLAVVVGVIATGSRGAQLCAIVVLVSIFFQAFPRWRLPTLFFLLVAGIGFLTAREEIVHLLAQYAQETQGGPDHVQINGMWHDYTGTKHRDLLDLVYEEAAEKNGWLGYGSLIRNLPVDTDMDERFRSIDNHYLMWFLQYGYLGIYLFCAFAISVLWNLLRPLFWATGATGRLAGGLFGALLGSAIVMRTVWFAPDYAEVWLFCAGMTVCVNRLHRSMEGTIPHG